MYCLTIRRAEKPAAALLMVPLHQSDPFKGDAAFRRFVIKRYDLIFQDTVNLFGIAAIGVGRIWVMFYSPTVFRVETLHPTNRLIRSSGERR